jgi:hypothetical protein
MKKIYADTGICSWHLNQLNLLKSEEIIAGHPAVFHMPFPYTSNFDTKISHAISVCSQVIILVSELHTETVKFITDHQNPNIVYFICGFINGYSNSNWMDWFINTCDFYKGNTLLTQLTPYKVKPKYFDILLGQQRSHRDVVYDYIIKNNYADKVILTYKNRSPFITPNQQDANWIWPDVDLEILESEIRWTITKVKYKEQTTSLSQIISTEIYNQSAYTVVAETNWDNHYSFYTEKIVKPILAERLFIVFSGQHYLRNLRSLGFKTFDGIIDETYDTIEDNNQRFKLACEQIEYLINQPQEEVLAKIRPITEHNKRVMMETDWLGDYFKELRAVLLDHTS